MKRKNIETPAKVIPSFEREIVNQEKKLDTGNLPYNQFQHLSAATPYPKRPTRQCTLPSGNKGAQLTQEQDGRKPKRSSLKPIPQASELDLFEDSHDQAFEELHSCRKVLTTIHSPSQDEMQDLPVEQNSSKATKNKPKSGGKGEKTSPVPQIATTAKAKQSAKKDKMTAEQKTHEEGHIPLPAAHPSSADVPDQSNTLEQHAIETPKENASAKKMSFAKRGPPKTAPPRLAGAPQQAENQQKPASKKTKTVIRKVIKKKKITRKIHVPKEKKVQPPPLPPRPLPIPIYPESNLPSAPEECSLTAVLTAVLENEIFAVSARAAEYKGHTCLLHHMTQAIDEIFQEVSAIEDYEPPPGPDADELEQLGELIDTLQEFNECLYKEQEEWKEEDKKQKEGNVFSLPFSELSKIHGQRDNSSSEHGKSADEFLLKNSEALNKFAQDFYWDVETMQKGIQPLLMESQQLSEKANSLKKEVFHAFAEFQNKQREPHNPTLIIRGSAQTV